MAKAIITHERLKSLLDYNPETGLFIWLQQTCRSRKTIGCVAGHFGHRYVTIRVDTREYLAHRLAWFYMTGCWPAAHVDHANLDIQDNRWSNLRQATPSQNSANKKALRTNKCGFKGVRANNEGTRWRAYIWSDGRTIHLGTFDTKELASKAYELAAKERHGEFARW